MKINRSAWTDAYRFHAEALEKLGEGSPEGEYWTWFHTRAKDVALSHHNGALILALMIAVFDDIEQRGTHADQTDTEKSA